MKDDEYRRLQDLYELVRVENEKIRKCAEKVVWFDWSDNDDDAVKAIDELRKALDQK